jgi:CO dehydrogenase maturation factor
MSYVIAVAGKGGTGKTTFSALSVAWLVRTTGKPVLAVDADSNANLDLALGTRAEKTIGGVREHLTENIKNMPAGMSKDTWVEMLLQQALVEEKGFDLISMGRPEGPGCYCYLNSLLRRFSEDLHNAYQWIVMDNEAGLEHLSRRTASRVDHLIVVINASVLSVDCARRITELIASLKNEVQHKHFIINGVSESRIEALRQRTEALGLNYLGSLPQDETVADCVFEGKSLFELNGSSPAVVKMSQIMKKLMED